MEELNSKKRVRDDSGETDLESPEVKRLRDDLLDLLDDLDASQVNQHLASVMKSFEEEISAPPPTSTDPAPVVDLASDSGESQPDLGYLLEASDDELGLPPPAAGTTSNEEVRSEVNELVRVDSESSSGMAEFWGFEDQIPNYDSFEFDIVDNYNGDHVVHGGLYEYPDVDGYYDSSSEFSGLLWRPETLSAE